MEDTWKCEDGIEKGMDLHMSMLSMDRKGNYVKLYGFQCN